jgi:predicted phosphodiesterase
MTTQTIAVISDIHGNRDALEAVFRDIDRRGITNIVNLGDCFYGPLDPAATAKLLMERDIPTVCGNEDRVIFDPRVKSSSNATLDFTRSALHSEHIQWLKTLPKTLIVFDNFLLCHGTPAQDNKYLLFEVTQQGLLPRECAELKELLPDISREQIVLCGHTHLFRALQQSGCPLVVNAGSVGLQAYTDDFPCEHKVSAGSPHARYAVITIRDRGREVEEVKIAYDWGKAAELADKNGRPDWGSWLRTGLCI